MIRKIARVVCATILCFAFFVAGNIAAHAGPYIYPNKGQSAEQQKKDMYECYLWASKQTGFDPAKQAQAAPPTQQQSRRGGVIRSTGRGAAIGLAVGAIADDKEKGVKIGAASGALIGGFRRRGRMRRGQHAQQQQRARYDAAQKEYDRAHGACLSGRGYTVR